MRFGLIILIISLVSCSEAPRKNYFQTLELDANTLNQLSTISQEVNLNSQHAVLSFNSGNRPIMIRMVPASQLQDENGIKVRTEGLGTLLHSGTLAHTRYLQYHCLIEVRDDIYETMDEQTGNFGPSNATNIERAVQLILLHEIGHCFGLDHTTDSNNIMFPQFVYNWVLDASVVFRFSQQLLQLSE